MQEAMAPTPTLHDGAPFPGGPAVSERGELLARIRALAGEYAAQHDPVDACRRREALEAEARETARRYVESHPLYANRDLDSAHTCILELAIDLTGARRVAVYLDDGARLLQPRACTGAPFAAFPSFRLGQDLHANALAGTAVHLDRKHGSTRVPDICRPGVCVPLEVLDRSLGAIVLFDAPPHGRFTALDHAVLAVLGHHATIAIMAEFYDQSPRGHTTVQSFIDLLTH
jgi:hypothetical protein